MFYDELKKRQRRERAGFHPNLNLRVHRAISWIGAYEQAGAELDSQFIHLWIAFNALYAQTSQDQLKLSESQMFKDFIVELIELDDRRQLEGLVWGQFTGSIRALLNNPFIYVYFWRYQNGKCSEEDWKKRFNGANKAAQKALASQNTAKTVSIVLSRLYVLRNQLLHGGATWNGKVNRAQLKSAVKFLSALVPMMINIMMDHPARSWPPAAYPVINP